MKKTKLLNSEISYEIAKLGHTQSIVIADCGLPIPLDVKRVDLALTLGVPSFKEVLEIILTEMQVEEYILAEEISTKNPQTEAMIRSKLPEIQSYKVPHEEFKQLCRNANLIIRTGEATPYSNIILKSGVVF